MAVFGQAVHPRLADVNGDFVPNAVDLFACVLSGQILSWISIDWTLNLDAVGCTLPAGRKLKTEILA